MLCEDWRPRPSERDEEVFRACVRKDHLLRRALAVIDWESFREALAEFYSPDRGRPGTDPVLILKLLFLRYLYRLSDREVIARTQTDMAFHYFLQIPVGDMLPDPSSLTYFRGRLGVVGFQKIFDEVVRQAREHGLVKDRMRLKDATHVVADIAVPTTLHLVAEVRDKLLAAAEPFDAVRVEGERVNVELLRESIGSQKPEARLVARVTHLREILAWVDQLTAPDDASAGAAWEKLIQVRQLAHKILADQDDPKAGDRTRSAVDPDARRGKHGDWYDGYLLDILVDPDSELITQINVLPASGDEAADAVELIRREEEAHGNDIDALSIDGIGFNGKVLRELEDPDGLAVDVYVPPKKEPADERFTPQDFTEDADQRHVTCPAGQQSKYRQHDKKTNARIYRFSKATCQACPLLSRCLAKPPNSFGRTVRKNDYEAEYQRARAKAATPEYAAVRSEHAKVERKLGEVANRHAGRRAHCRGRPKVFMQELMTCATANIKRMARLLRAPQPAMACR